MFQKMPNTKARKFKPQRRLEPALQHWWQARADVLTMTPRIAPIGMKVCTSVLPESRLSSVLEHNQVRAGIFMQQSSVFLNQSSGVFSGCLSFLPSFICWWFQSTDLHPLMVSVNSEKNAISALNCPFTLQDHTDVLAVIPSCTAPSPCEHRSQGQFMAQSEEGNPPPLPFQSLSSPSPSQL